MGSLVIYSLYFVTGVGVNDENCGILEALARHKDRHGLAWIAGADWNMEPDELMQTEIGTLLKTKPMVPEANTCISLACAHTIDYFLVGHQNDF